MIGGYALNKKVLQGMETKSRILECARKLFREKGYDNVTVDEIIKDADSSKGGFYTHFSSKRELLITMMPIVHDAYRDFISTKSDYKNTLEKISAFICFSFDLIKNEIGLATMSAVYSAHINGAPIEGILVSSDVAFLRLLNDLIIEGQFKNEIAGEFPSRHICDIIISCMRGVIFDWCLKRGSFDLTEYGKEVTTMILNQIKNYK